MTADYDALIFDMDGVIIDSEPAHAEAKRRTFAHYDLAVPDTLYDEFKGQTDEAVMEHVAATYGRDGLTTEALLGRKHRAYEALLSEVQPVPGALAFLRQAVERYRLALVTSATPHNQQRAFDRFDLHVYFEAVVTAADVTEAKPAPEPYARGAARLNVSPARCLVLEDSAHGVASARAAGCDVVGLPTSFSTAQLREAGATRVVESFDELAEALDL